MDPTSNLPAPRARLRLAAAVLALLAAPAVLLAPCLFGDAVFVPFDLAGFAPKHSVLDAAARAELADRGPESRWPRNPDVTEIPILVLPEIRLARDELLAGRFPGWNPYARFGAPLFANGLAGLAYPPNLPLLALDEPARGLAFKAWFSLALGGVLLFALLRAHRVPLLPATLGALAFGIGGTASANAHFYMRLDALVWLPGVLLACLRLVRAPTAVARVVPTVALAAASAATLLAGFPPFAIAGLITAGIYSAALLLTGIRRDGARATLGRALALLAGVAAGAGLAAVQLLPAFAFFPESNRDLEPPLEAVRSQAFASFGWLGYLLPSGFGVPGGAPPYDAAALPWLLQDLCRLDDGRLFTPPNYNYTEYAVFAGTVPFLLALLALTAARPRRLALGFGALAILLATVARAPGLLAALYEIPVLASVPPMRFMGPVAAIVAILAALGLAAVLRERRTPAAWLVGSVALLGAAAAAGVALRSPLGDVPAVAEALAARYAPQVPGITAEGALAHLGGGDVGRGTEAVRHAAERLDASLWRAVLRLALGGGWLIAMGVVASRSVRQRLALAAVVVTAAELLSVARPVASGRPLPHDPRDTPTHAFLREREAERSERGGILVARAARQPKIPVDLPPGTLFPERIADLNAYAFVDSRSWRSFVAIWGEQQMIRSYWPLALPDDPRLAHPLLDLMGVDTLLTTDELTHAGDLLHEQAPAEPGLDTFRVYARPEALPRAFVVHRRTVVADDAAVLAAITSPDLEPRAALLLTAADAARLPAAPEPPATPPATPRPARITALRSDHVAVEVGDGPAGDLLLRDAAMAGWTATVDGRDAPLARANLFMRAVPVPAGACRVEFHYAPPGLAAGVGVSAATLAALGAALIVARRRRRGSSPAGPAVDGPGGAP